MKVKRFFKNFWSGIKSIRPYQWGLYAVLLLVGLLMLYFLIFSILGSLTTNIDFERTTFLPKPYLSQFKNYGLIFLSEGLFRSVMVTLLRIAIFFVIVSATSILGGYAFAKLRFPLKRFFFMLLMMGMMIPGVALMVPNFVWMARFPLVGGNNILGQGGHGFVDNPLFFLITGWLSIYNIFLCRQAFSSLGNEMKESAQIDGARFVRIVFTIYVPLIRPILAVIFLNLFIGIWNDYMSNMIYMSGVPEFQTVGWVFVKMINYYTSPFKAGGAEFPKAYAISTISMIPPILVYITVQRSFVEGLALGGVKG